MGFACSATPFGIQGVVGFTTNFTASSFGGLTNMDSGSSCPSSFSKKSSICPILYIDAMTGSALGGSRITVPPEGGWEVNNQGVGTTVASLSRWDLGDRRR